MAKRNKQVPTKEPAFKAGESVWAWARGKILRATIICERHPPEWSVRLERIDDKQCEWILPTENLSHDRQELIDRVADGIRRALAANVKRTGELAKRLIYLESCPKEVTDGESKEA